MRSLLRTIAFVLVCLPPVVSHADSAMAATYRIVETLDVDTVPSWFPVGFCLLTHDGQQYVAYYNDQHQMMVAQRGLDDREWRRAALPSKVGWDSHNYITMAVDSTGHIHLSGNMHCVPLIYFRTTKPGDITTFERHAMTGQEEQRCTYPRFLNDADGNLLFTYRSGGSGNGRRFYNAYDGNTQSWSRFLNSPLFEGEGKRNAYPHGPVKGPDGLFHVVWVWRDTPDCATNHHLSYARSRDLKHWETAAGDAVDLPLTLEQAKLCVDPVPSGGGIINGCEHLAFDSSCRPIISYHKSDEDGHMQIYVTRFEDGQWRRHPITAWNKNITFGGGGAMPFIGIRISGLVQVEPGAFTITYRHRDYGSGRFVLDEETLRPVERDLAIPSEHPNELTKPTIAFDGISVRLAHDVGSQDDSDTRYLLRWETLGAHHDRPRKPPLPPASALKLVKLLRE
ncbi:MAG: BNR repeat-containing protein [Pirellulaceae bacterium]|nr:BNR repeat-containing protein [Pirellulaceae bacterium]